MACYCPEVRVIEPWAKDMREWVRAGATAADVNDAIEQAEPIRIRIKCRGGAR
ncbi:MAG: hypothetical protein IPJ41_16390 [Phycisphaerales bacterium]|nr:hypothetical protein [Phycisphaerales bacterium]